VNGFFSIYVMLPAVIGPGVYSASKRKCYRNQKKSFGVVERGRYVGLTALPPSVKDPALSKILDRCGILNISQPYKQRPVTGVALLLLRT
jgi:hypothetical protein